MVYIPSEKSSDYIAKVIYTSKDGRSKETFDAVDWLARLVVHIPGRYEQTVRYYGYYSNKSRGLRKKNDTDDDVPALMSGEKSSKAFRKNWARLIQKIYEVDPLTCPKCKNQMRIISIIDEKDVIKKILKHLDLWETHNHDPPNKQLSYEPDISYDDEYSQIPNDWN